MSTRPQLVAQPREITGKKVSGLRRAGQLPAVVYGHGHASEPIVVDAREFATLRRHVGRNALVDLKIGSSRTTPVLVHGVQEDPVTRRTLHADFFVVRMTEEMTVDVPVVVVGESVAVEKLGGTLLHMRETIQVRALPADLPQSIELDVSGLDTFDQMLHVSDLHLPDRVTLVTDTSEVLARVQAPRTAEAEETPSEGAAEGEAGEGGTAAQPGGGTDEA